MQRSLLLAVVLLGACSILVAQDDKKESSAKESKSAKGKKDDAITMTVITRTGSMNRAARADAIKIFVLLNGDTAHKTRLKDPRKDNFELGAVDTFAKLPVKMPLNEIQSIRLAVEGDDMWKCEAISVQFFQKDMKSKLYKFTPGRYLSAGKEKKGFKATRLLDFKLNPPPKLAADTPDEDDSEKPSKSGDKEDKPEKGEAKTEKKGKK